MCSFKAPVAIEVPIKWCSHIFNRPFVPIQCITLPCIWIQLKSSTFSTTFPVTFCSKHICQPFEKISSSSLMGGANLPVGGLKFKFKLLLDRWLQQYGYLPIGSYRVFVILSLQCPMFKDIIVSNTPWVNLFDMLTFFFINGQNKTILEVLWWTLCAGDIWLTFKKKKARVFV